MTFAGARTVTESDVSTYAESLERNGFFGPDAYYMNHDANAAYAALAENDGRLDMPVLFLGAQYDYVCDTVTSRLAEGEGEGGYDESGEGMRGMSE